jgi:hypothetical protein
VGIEFDLRNAGAKGGDEVIQVYVKSGLPGEPIKSLKWFQRKFMAEGTVERISVNLTALDFAIFNETTGNISVTAGTFEVCVGGSSADASLVCANVVIAGDESVVALVVVIVIAAVTVIGVLITVCVCWKRNPPGVEKLRFESNLSST